MKSKAVFCFIFLLGGCSAFATPVKCDPIAINSDMWVQPIYDIGWGPIIDESWEIQICSKSNCQRVFSATSAMPPGIVTTERGVRLLLTQEQLARRRYGPKSVRLGKQQLKIEFGVRPSPPPLGKPMVETTDAEWDAYVASEFKWNVNACLAKS
jgi:hypothetical protein